MSIHSSDQNHNLTSTGTYLTLPALAAAKGANVSCVFGMFFATQKSGWENNQTLIMAARQAGGTGGNDAYFGFAQACTSLTFRLRNGGLDLIAATDLVGLTAGSKYLLLLVINPTNTHVIAAPVDGGTPLVSTFAISTPYAANMSATALINSLGGSTGAVNYSWMGDMENAFFLTGQFPESGGIPNDTLIRNIASGVQDINTLDAQLTSGVKKFWYPMRHNRDLSDAFGLVADLTYTNEDRPVGKFCMNGVALRPESVRPADADWAVSQTYFATPGSSATATASVPVQGGTYSGISPTAVQARLIKEDGTTHVDWTQIATAAGGVWAAGTLPSVPMVAGILHLDIRAVDGGGSQLGNIQSGGIRGVGFHLFITGQSQAAYWYENGAGLAIPSGSRLISYVQKNTVHRRAMVGSSSAINRLARRGLRQTLIEINTLYPGVPVQFTSIAEAGQPIDQFITGGSFVARWAAVAASFGVSGPMYLTPVGHSSGADSTYQTKFTDLITLADANLGVKKVICIPVPRYKNSGATLAGNALQVHESRRGMRAWHELNRSRSVWGSSFACVTSETGEASVSVDPHPGDDATGQGRAGAILAFVGMSACRAIVDEPVGIVSATGRGTSTVTLTLGRISDYQVA